MSGPQGMGALTPNITIPGSIGGIGSGYDDEVLALGAIWFSALDVLEAAEWPTYTEAIAHDEYRFGRGPIFVEHWTDEYTSMEWPLYQVAIDDNAALLLGPYWLTAYWAQSSQPAYNVFLPSFTDPLWHARLQTTESAAPYGGTISIVGGYRYHRWIRSSQAPFFLGTAGAITVDGILVGAGGGGSGGSGAYGGGGGGGEVELFSGRTITNSRSDVVIGIGGGRGTGTQGGTGGSSTFDGLTSLGGGGGGFGNSNGSNGASGGGAGINTSSGVNGTGGTGSPGGNGGPAFSGNVATARGGSGGGAAGSATGPSGTGGTQSVGGSGLQWYTAFTSQYFGGGGAAAGGGTAGAGGGAPGTANAPALNSGGGGGGGSHSSVSTVTSNAGADGTLILRYPYP